MRNKAIIRIALLPVILLLFLSMDGSRHPAGKPNIILIYADDLGIGLLGHEGQQIIETPNLDRLAEEGIRFQNAYSCMLCAPARASLITGQHDCHAQKFEITNAGIYKKIGTGELSQRDVEQMIQKKLSPVPVDQVFLGQIAREKGYETAQFGKLGWGFASTHQQMKRHGWDSYFGYLDHVRAHGFYPPYLFANGELVEIPGNTYSDCGKSGEPETLKTYTERWDKTGKEVYSQGLFMDSILSYMEVNKNRPFFLYFPTQLPHGPVSVPELHPDFINYQGLTQIEKEYASMVKRLDDDVGMIMEKLKELQIENNTLVIFTSDNGHEIYYAQKDRIHKPYTNMKTGEVFDNFERKYYSELAGDVFDGNGGRAGMKRSNLQGGIDVPLIIRWPDKIPRESVSHRLIANYDILATIAEITGYKKAIHGDGLSFCSELMDSKPGEEHDFVIFSSFEGPTLITKEGWKIRTVVKKNSFELYNLNEDFREENNLAEKYPDKLKQLKLMLLNACEGDLNNGLYSTQQSQMDI